ncbi:MAG: hypothetical protein QGH40_12705, partial [bacterium]|nr:hypothetical protein [bacterium]
MITKRGRLVVSVLLLSVVACSWATAAQLKDSGSEDFRQGRFANVALDSRGFITGAPGLNRLLELDQAFVWCAVSGSGGKLLAGCGNDGTIIRFTMDGSSETLCRTNELGVMSLLPQPDGSVLAGTSPNGLVYRIDQEGRHELLAETGDRYVWCLLNRGDELLAATGPGGQVVRVIESEAAKPVAKVQEKHVLSMVCGPEGTLYLGVSGTGMVYSVNPGVGSPEIVAKLSRADVRSLLVDKKGNLIAVAAGEAAMEESVNGHGNEELGKTPEDGDYEPPRFETGNDSSKIPGRKSQKPPLDSDPVASKEPSPDPFLEDDMEDNGAPSVSGITGEGAGAVYEIKPDGQVTVLAEFKEMILTAFLTRDGEIIVGGAEKGRLYKINRRGGVTYLGRVQGEQVLDIMSLKDGHLVLTVGNPGGIWVLDPKTAAAGEFTSRVLDAGSHAYWGALQPVSVTPAGTSVTVSTRTGKKLRPDDTWNGWMTLGENPENKIKSPSSRYIQYRLKLARSKTGLAPSVHGVTVNYRKPNQAPRVTPPSVSFTTPSTPGGTNDEQNPPYKAELAWEATDTNEDTLLFDLFLKSEQYGFEHKLTRDSIGQSSFTLDTRGVPDGQYRVRVLASDKIQHGIEKSMTGEAVSYPFIIDNSPPSVTVSNVSVNGKTGIWTVTVGCEDVWSAIHGVRVSLDGEKWEIVPPLDGIFDSLKETVVWQSSGNMKPESGLLPRHSLVVQCWDEHGN